MKLLDTGKIAIWQNDSRYAADKYHSTKNDNCQKVENVYGGDFFIFFVHLRLR